MIDTESVKQATQKSVREYLDSPMTAVEELLQKMIATFPGIAPCHIGAAREIATFAIVRGRKRLQFLDRSGLPIEVKAPLKSNRLLRKWAKAMIGRVMVDIVFQPVMPVNSIDLNLILSNKDAAHTLV